MSSNQGRDLDLLLQDVPMLALQEAATALWTEVEAHDDTASCECPVIEALARLYELGYRVVQA